MSIFFQLINILTSFSENTFELCEFLCKFLVISLGKIPIHGTLGYKGMHTFNVEPNTMLREKCRIALQKVYVPIGSLSLHICLKILILTIDFHRQTLVG